MDYKKLLKVALKYHCEKCDYSTSKKSSWLKHLQTKKHNDYIKATNDYICLCEKKFNHRQNYYRHKKTCKIFNKQEQNDEWINMDKKWINMDKNEKCPFLCVCGNTYKFQSGLSKHKKTCQVLLSKQQEHQQLDNNVMIEMKEMFTPLNI